MYDLRLEFTDQGIIFINTDEEMINTGFPATAQDVLLHLATNYGSDLVNPDRGTSIEKQALQTGVVVSTQAATHVANIAASDAILFIQNTEDPEEDNGLVEFELAPVSLENQTLKLNALVTSEKGDVIGTSANLTLE